MGQSFNNSQNSKRSMPALVIMIIAFSFSFLNFIINVILNGSTTISNFLNFLIQISPMVLLAIYIIAFQNKQKLTVFVPLAIILLNFSIFQDFINSFNYVYEYGYTSFGSNISNFILAFTFHVPMFIFTGILIADAFKGLKKIGLVIAYSIFSYVYMFCSSFQFFIELGRILHFLSPAFIISYLFNFFACILFPIALLIFAKNGNVPSICKPKEIVQAQVISTNSNIQTVASVNTENQPIENIAVFCPNCGEKFNDDAIFCTKCGRKR